MSRPPGWEVFSQGQGIYEDQKQIAKILALPLEKVRVQLVPNGGGFGGKEDLSVQGHAALYAYHLQRPVRVALTRDESINMHPKRHPLWMECALGCDAHGKLTAVKGRIIGDSGAYASVGMKVLEHRRARHRRVLCANCGCGEHGGLHQQYSQWGYARLWRQPGHFCAGKLHG
ncbi:MAG: molybdopterin cofactor-binding domain-containing protein [Caldilineaceae bacterium]